ncbi:hypothetical protein GWK47_015507 [Chionoecetes opilio]|uniref:Endonuclease/exonuclease/phosphatase domain-containing protein n=1 Tax=Chionoecetes opilio TaxID=41210 RepID=A0A8J5CIB4_CHIOP|nr:hypothetical protein GWK47_015507 [Chionoecetes opilio]
MITCSAAPANTFPPGVGKTGSERVLRRLLQTLDPLKRPPVVPSASLPRAKEAHDDDDENVPPLVIDMSVMSEEQQEAEQGKDWTTMANGCAARPKFKLGSLEDHASAYLAITALEDENPALRMERHKVVLERYPVDFPLDAAKAQPHVVSATRLRGWDNIATRQVLIVHEGPPPAKLTLRSWGTYTLRPYRSEPVRCYKCQRFNHLQVRCEHSVRCGVCSLNHPTEDCIGRHKSKEATTAKCPNFEQQRQHRFIPAPLPAWPAWVKAAKQPSPLVPRDPTPGRGSDGRESEAQPPVSVEEAATITPAAIPPPLPKRETGTKPRPPHRSRPQGHPPSQPPAPALPEAPATATARAEGRRTASCHRYDNIPSARRLVQLLIASSSARCTLRGGSSAARSSPLSPRRTLTRSSSRRWNQPSISEAVSHDHHRGIQARIPSSQKTTIVHADHADNDTPHAAPPAAAPRLKVLQWNAQGLRPKKHQVLQAIFEEDLDMVLLQETLTPADFKWRIAGYSLHSLPATEGTRGCVTLVRSAIPHRRITDPVHCGDGVEALAVALHVGGLELTVYHLYRSQRHQLEAGELLTMASHTSLLVAGYFNAHHPTLQSVSATNLTGRHLAVLLDEVHPTLTSDHYATLTTLTAAPPIPPRPPSRWNVKRADWGKFQASLDEWWVTYEPPGDLHQQERDFKAALQRASDAAIPKCSPGHRHRPDWWFYNEDVREHNHRVNLHRKLYKRQPSPTILRLMQDVVTRARQVSQRAREAKWLEWCASFNQHTSLAQLWRNVRTASDAAPPRPAAHLHPHREAERLIGVFTARGSSAQLPPRIRHLQQQLRQHRVEAVREAHREPDVADHLFTRQELSSARKKGRDTLQRTGGVTYSMLAHAGPAGTPRCSPRSTRLGWQVTCRHHRLHVICTLVSSAKEATDECKTCLFMSEMWIKNSKVQGPIPVDSTVDH